MRKPAHVRAAAPVSRFDVLESLGRFDECDARLLPLRLSTLLLVAAESASRLARATFCRSALRVEK